ncbi:hypothetical protein Ciccas_008691 [Cichlidogyrus casuarinus]|uniref:Uncharacterized protein n=1 Tax=Cichlidogyrus casuarinus TaxID=1844966 RepID=A0ABD2PZ60_9PLAT
MSALLRQTSTIELHDPKLTVLARVDASQIKYWLFALSKVAAVYTTMTTRFGTKSDGIKLRKSAKKTRNKGIRFAKSVHSSLIMSLTPEGEINDEVPREDFLQLLSFFCSSMEYFLVQLQRTLDLYEKFRLNAHPNAEWPLKVTYPLIYAGFIALPRKKKYTSTNPLGANAAQSECPRSAARNATSALSILEKTISISSIGEQLNACSLDQTLKESSRLAKSLHDTQNDRHFVRIQSESFGSSAEDSDFPSIILPEDIISPDEASDYANVMQVNNNQLECLELDDLHKDIELMQSILIDLGTRLPDKPWMRSITDEEQTTPQYSRRTSIMAELTTTLNNLESDEKLLVSLLPHTTVTATTTTDGPTEEEKKFALISSYRRRIANQKKCLVALLLSVIILCFATFGSAIWFYSRATLQKRSPPDVQPILATSTPQQ